MKQGTDTLRVLFWNVRNFGAKNDKRRLEKVADILRAENPDVACIAEVVHSGIKAALACSFSSSHGVVQSGSNEGGARLVSIFKKNAGYINKVLPWGRFTRHDGGGGASFPLIYTMRRNRNDPDKMSKLAVLGVHFPAKANPFRHARRLNLIEKIGYLSSNLKQDGVSLLVMGDMNTAGDGQWIETQDEINLIRKILRA
jgi:exonuclease III